MVTRSKPLTTRETQQEPQTRSSRGPLALAGTGALLASACCVLPFVLVVLGLGGAWMSTLHALFPYRWLFIGGAALALFLAWRRLYQTPDDCDEGQACAKPTVQKRYRILFWLVVILLVVSAFAPYVLGIIIE